MLRELLAFWNSSSDYRQRITILSMFCMNFTYPQLAALNSVSVQGRRSRRYDHATDSSNPIDNAIAKIPDKNFFHPPLTRHIYMRSRMMYHEFQVCYDSKSFSNHKVSTKKMIPISLTVWWYASSPKAGLPMENKACCTG